MKALFKEKTFKELKTLPLFLLPLAGTSEVHRTSKLVELENFGLSRY